MPAVHHGVIRFRDQHQIADIAVTPVIINEPDNAILRYFSPVLFPYKTVFQLPVIWLCHLHPDVAVFRQLFIPDTGGISGLVSLFKTAPAGFPDARVPLFAGTLPGAKHPQRPVRRLSRLRRPLSYSDDRVVPKCK